MKRLVILTLLLVPCAVPTVEHFVDQARHGVPIGPRFSRHEPPPVELIATNDPAAREVKGFPMATKERAVADAWRAVDDRIASRLAAEGLSRGWIPPRPLVASMVADGSTKQFDKDYGTVYVHTLYLDESAPQVRRLLESHEREISGRRLVKLGGVLGFLLVCLATLSGYIRADEATKGYYTRTLRAGSLVAVGAAGTALYMWLV